MVLGIWKIPAFLEQLEEGEEENLTEGIAGNGALTRNPWRDLSPHKSLFKDKPEENRRGDYSPYPEMSGVLQQARQPFKA